MLQNIRDKTQTWIIWVIMALIIIPFALWGIGDYMQPDSDINVAKVDDSEITLNQFQQAYEQQQQRLRSMLGSDFKAPEEEKMKQDVLDRLIRSAVLQESAAELGLRVSDQQLSKQILSMAEFQDNGQFSKKRYEEVLRSQGLATQGLEKSLRQALVTEQLQAGITSTAIVTAHEVDNAIRLKKQQREIGYLVLPKEQFKKEVTISERAVKEHYEANRESLISPEQVSLEYIELAAADIAKSAVPDEKELRKLYEEQKATFLVPGQRRASQIVITPDPKTGLAGIATAIAEGKRLAKTSRGKGDFAKLAEQYSDDADTAKQGGDMGYFTQGAKDPALEQALSELQIGEVSEPIKGPKGFHVLKLTGINPERTKQFDEVRAELEKQAVQEIAKKQFFDKTEPLANLAYEHPDTLTIAAKELGLKIKTTKLFSRKGGAGIAARPEIIKAAFSDEVLEQGYNSEPLEIGENQIVVVRVKEHKPATPLTFAAARADIAQQLRLDAARNKAEAVGETMQKRLQNGENPEAIAKEYGVEWVKTGLIGREDSKASSEILAIAFELAKPEKTSAPSRPTVGGKLIDSGDYVIVAVNEVRDGEPEGLESAERLALKRELQRTKSDTEYDHFADGLKEKSDIVVYRDKL